MDGSGTIQVVKRDGKLEPFDRRKLASALYRAMTGYGGDLVDAEELAWAIEIYAERRDWRSVSSLAILEMSLKVLRRVRMDAAADAMEAHWLKRDRARRMVRVWHRSGQVTWWDKGWVCDLARHSWRLSETSARIIAAEVERRVLGLELRKIDRADVVDVINDCVVEFGLADAVPVPDVARRR